MHYLLECLYCGHKYKKYFYSETTARNECCEKCGDKHLRIRDPNKGKIDQYKNEKKEIKKDEYDDQTWD